VTKDSAAVVVEVVVTTRFLPNRFNLGFLVVIGGALVTLGDRNCEFWLNFEKGDFARELEN